MGAVWEVDLSFREKRQHLASSSTSYHSENRVYTLLLKNTWFVLALPPKASMSTPPAIVALLLLCLVAHTCRGSVPLIKER